MYRKASIGRMRKSVGWGIGVHGAERSNSNSNVPYHTVPYVPRRELLGRLRIVHRVTRGADVDRGDSTGEG